MNNNTSQNEPNPDHDQKPVDYQYNVGKDNSPIPTILTKVASKYTLPPPRDPQASGDLEANKNGLIPPAQIEYILRLNPKVGYGNIYNIFASFLGFIVTGCSFIFGIFYYIDSIFHPKAINSQITQDTPPYGLIFLIFFPLLFGFALNKSLQKRKQYSLLRKDLESGEIAQGDGQFVIRRGRYRLLVDDKRLNFGLLPPPLVLGNHHFYFLPRSRWFLSAERREGPTDPKMLNLIEKTRNINATGRMTSKQRYLLVQMAGLLIFVPCTIVFLFLLNDSINGDYNDGSSQQIAYIRPGGCFLIMMFFLVSFIRAHGSFNHLVLLVLDAFGGKVNKVEGILTDKQALGRRNYCQIDGFELRIPAPAMMNLLNIGEPYLMYYAPRSKLILYYKPLKSAVENQPVASETTYTSG